MECKSLQFSLAEKRGLLNLSRKTLKAGSSESARVLAEFSSNTDNLTPALMEILPCFVTLNEKNGRLRGCIGTTTTYNPLYKNVHYFTLQAANADPRFSPVESQEVEDLWIDISVLGPLQPFSLPELKNLEIGKQGLYVRHMSRHGLLLASVAVEFDWTPPEFLRHTCEKAGLSPEKVEQYEILRFDQISFGEKDFPLLKG